MAAATTGSPAAIPSSAASGRISAYTRSPTGAPRSRRRPSEGARDDERVGVRGEPALLYQAGHANTWITIVECRERRVTDGMDFPGWVLTTWNDQAHL